MRTLLLASDLDHTMVQNEDPTHKRLLAFDHSWLANGAASSGQKLLVFSTGRSPELFKKLWHEAPLITPDVLICSVGSEIFYNTASPVLRTLLAASPQQQQAAPTPAPFGIPQGPEFQPDGSWEAFLDVGWDRSKAQALVAEHFPLLTPQAASEQRSHKVSYGLDPNALPGGKAEAAQLMERLQKVLKEENGINAKVIYSGGRDVDVLSEAAGKGRGLSFLLQRLKESGFEPSNVQVNGDSGNDIELFEVPGVKGCVVSNAHPELRAFAEAQVAKGDAAHICQATEPCAGGILQAMQHFGLLQLPQPASSPAGALQTAALQNTNVPSDGHNAQAASQQALQWQLLSGEVGAREFAWRLGTPLAQVLREGITTSSDLVNHTALRLVVANDCSAVLQPPAPSDSQHSPPPASSASAGGDAAGKGTSATESPQEVKEDLEPVPVVEAAEHSDFSHAWIDELSCVQVAQGASSSADAAEVQQEALASSGGNTSRLGTWKLRFKVYCLDRPVGTRDRTVHEVEAVVQQQAQPVPNGFLAKSIHVAGPYDLQQVLPRINAKMH
ncbi:sucrose-6F-phosphate phosphohydrolase-domain-containing protein [Dunaliella salina]|uniref:Sucrose-6F-phosphate phosphohydrolase-domain-containing protein n=1 Tax=Dunaliella salina TaxID=3046 RepID=A0ABQ7GTM7_DUNSA|nr:sucrose-6F-phosphate phosphohydrolase-domain-containing protein [Dunaliella salina]|eukprot:KAF5837960.1 sucrose-6F-phosphate phosphohydrolase-domain-containing protein [Dunaliella salina]